MIDANTLNDLKAYLEQTHHSYRDRMKPTTVGEWEPEKAREGFNPYYISPKGEHNNFSHDAARLGSPAA